MQETLRILMNAILNKEEELPVKVEAAFAVEAFVQDQHRTHPFVQSQVFYFLLVVHNTTLALGTAFTISYFYTLLFSRFENSVLSFFRF